MFFHHNTGKTGNNAIKMSWAFHNFAGFECFSDLNLQNMCSMSFKSEKQMHYNKKYHRIKSFYSMVLFFLLAVTVEGDESIAG